MVFRKGFALLPSTLYRSSPSWLVDNIDSYRYVRATEKSPVLFFHIPKSGGTSLSITLYGRKILHVPASVIYSFNHDYLTSKPSFAVLRNPFLRAVSAYNFVLNGGTDLVWVDYRNEYDMPEFKCQNSFFRDLLPIFLGNNINPVFETQMSYVCNSTSVLVRNLFVLENPRPLLCYLSSHLDDPHFKMPTYNSSPVPYKLRISSSSFESISKVYSVDIEHYCSIAAISRSSFLSQMRSKLVA